MRKWMRGCLALFAAAPMILMGNASSVPEPKCKAAYLCDAASGTVVYEMNAETRLPIASMCKIMTLTLAFEEAEKGGLSPDEQITVSEHAAGMGGSQVFLGAGLSYTASELMKAVAVCSANDACVALAERIAGSEAGFVDKMNARARELGATNTLFSNCTGLPKDPQYSCAKDVSCMLRALIAHQKYFDYAKVWTEEFKHPDGRTTLITNTNKLVRFYQGCDGGKTGFTNEAGSCLAATAKRQGTRLIAVVIGADNSKSRNAAVSALFDYAFGAYETRAIVKAGEEIGTCLAAQGSRKTARLTVARDLCGFVPRGEEGEFTVQYELCEGLKAPIPAGTEVGDAVLYRAGVEADRTKIVTLDGIERVTWWDSFRETLRNWQ